MAQPGSFADFQAWMDAVDKALQQAGRGFTIHDLNPATLSSAFQSGASPVIFAKTVQPPPAAPPVVGSVAAVSSAQQQSNRLVTLIIVAVVVVFFGYLAVSTVRGAQRGIDAYRERNAAKSESRNIARWGITNIQGSKPGSLLKIEGDFRNNTGEALRFARVEFECYDAQDRKVSTARDTISNLAPGETWHFKAVCFDPDAVKYAEYPDVETR